MCGLGCVIELGGNVPPQEGLRQLSEALVHRGPDDEGIFTDANVGLVFRRLSIIDLSNAGHQPMLSASGRHAIVFNGEIFNFIELRVELERKGHVFKSSSDTEVLLDAYLEWGADCLPRLNGMFAFAILDTTTHECFFARDRFGVKPLYCFRGAQRIVFASEVSAILRSGLCHARVDRSSVAKYLFFGDLDNSNATFYENITAVAPGTWVSINPAGNTRCGRYWELPQDADATPDCRKLYELFEDSVRLRLRSDVPVGVFLSGGVDSTAILCAASRHLGPSRSINAYSFMAPEYDESRYIHDTVNQTGANLMPLQIDAAQLWDQLRRMIRYQDGPVHSPAALIGFSLCEMAARNGTKVVLNGQGADETFAGYSNYFRIHWQTLLGQMRFRSLASQLGSYGAQHGLQLSALIRQVLASFFKARLNRIRLYRWTASLQHRRAFQSHPLYARGLVDYMSRSQSANRRKDLGETLRLAVTHNPLPLYLRVEDRNAMANSIEARLPFLDYRLVSAVMRIAGRCKLDGYWNKVLLREAMHGRIPESVRSRPDKMGFETPDAKWIRSWAPEIESIFRSREFAERGFFNGPNLLAALAHHVSGARQCHEAIFRVLQVELYLRCNE